MKTPTASRGTDVHKPSQLLYAMVRDRILADLATLELASGQRYYTEAELAQRHRVSRNTVRRAMAELERRGYLKRQRGLGSVVRQLPGSLATSTTDALPGPPPISEASERLLTILPQWDDSTEGFYAARILRELTGLQSLRGYSIEIRHPSDPLDVQPSTGLTCFAIDPGPATAYRLASLAEDGVRIVTLTPATPMPFAVNLCDDTRRATYEAVRLFHQMGHSRIGIVVHDLSHNDYRMALHGFLDAHCELDLPILPHAIVRSFHGATMSPPPPPRVDQMTAWVATFAAGVNLLGKACVEYGLSVPDDVSIIGLDDPSDHQVGLFGKNLTVIRADPAATARTLSARLQCWDDNLRGQMITLPMEHVQRESVAPPRHARSTRSPESGV